MQKNSFFVFCDFSFLFISSFQQNFCQKEPEKTRINLILIQPRIKFNFLITNGSI